jgi:predicted ATP-dependent endonuclease of OLD family
MKITKLHITNFLKLKDVEINPSAVNVIVGKNRQGKTSLLKAIRAAFDGKIDESSIRIGENKAEIIIDLDDLTIKRTLTTKGNYLDISNKAGMKMPSPQQYLNGILGVFSFNPIQFFELKQTDRKKYLLNAIKLVITQDELANYTGEKLAGLDYEGTHALEVVEIARKHYYEKRTIANAELNKKEKSLQDLTSKIPEGFDPKSVSEEQITKLRNAIQIDKLNKQKQADHILRVQNMQKQETELKEQIDALQIKLKFLETEILEALETKFDVSDDISMAAFEETLAKLEGQREVVFTVKRADEVRGELNTAIEEASKLDGIVKKLTKELPEDLIKKAKLPVEGLTIEGDDIKINGVSLDNLSSSEQLRFGLQVVRALNGEFKVICCDGVELLDPESFEFFLKEIADDEFQYFISRVSDEKVPHSIIIEDGEIKQ